MIALLLVCLISQATITAAAGRGRESSLFGINSITKSRGRVTQTAGKSSRKVETSTYYSAFDAGGSLDDESRISGVDSNVRNVILVEHQISGNQKSDDDGNSEDMSGDDSDFDIGEDDIDGSDGVVSYRDEEDEEEDSNAIRTQKKLVGTGGGGDDNNDSGDRNNRINSRPSYDNDDENDGIEDHDDFNVTEGDDSIAAPYDESKNSNSISQLKGLWKNFILTAKAEQYKVNKEKMDRALRQQINENKDSTGDNIENYQDMPLSHILSKFPALLRANGTDSASFHRQLESQFLDPVAGGSNRAVWMDQEFALVLKGAAVIAQYPDMTSSTAGSRISRSVRIQSPSCSQATSQDVVNALARSLNSTLITLNRKEVEKMRRAATIKKISKTLLTTANLISSLFDEIEEEKIPVIIALNDDIHWLLHSEATGEIFIEEMKSSTSRIFFVFLQADTEIKIGQTATSLRDEKTQKPIVDPAPIPGGFPNFASFFQNQSPMSGYSYPNTPQQNQQQIQQQQSMSNKQDGQDQFTPSFQPPQGAGPGPIPGVSGSMPPGIVFGRSFQVSIQNGTATMTPIPSPSMGQGMFPGQGPGSEGFPSEAMMRRIIEEQQQRMSQGGQGMTPEQQQQQFQSMQMLTPPFPPNLSEEELQEYLSKPENQPAMKEFLDRLIQMAVSQLPPGTMGMNGMPGMDGAPMMDVKVHMMSIPIPMNMNNMNMNNNYIPGMGQGQGFGPPPSFKPESFKKAFYPESDSNDEKKEIEREKREDKQSKKEGLRGLPGMSFFKGIRGKAVVPDKKEKTVKKPLKPVKMTKVSSVTEERDVHYDDEKKKGELTTRGKQLLSSFETLLLEAPRDQGLRVLWDQRFDEELGRRISKLNRRSLSREMRRQSLWFSDTDATGSDRSPPGLRVLRALEDVLQKQVLSEDEAKRTVAAAIRLQAGRFDASPLYIPPSVTIQLPTSTSFPTSSDDVTAHTGVQTKTHAPALQTPESAPKNQRLRLTYWALDTALSAIFKGPNPRLGRPSARSKEEISAMVTDKHERALIGNVITPQDIGVTYDMIGGLAEVKETLRQCVTYPLKYPRLYREGVAAEAVKGVLLFGPPGTGKTMLAKAVATEGGATFLTVDASTIENKWLGESEKNAKAVFTLARRLAPCVVYLDEVDSVLSSRENGDDSSHGTLTSVKTTLMQEWDGLRTTKDRVVVIASTNRPFDLDEAVLRRLPRRIMVDLPDCQTRAEILAVTLSGNRMAPDVNFTMIAASLEGYTGSDIKEVCREAVVRVAHERAHALEIGTAVGAKVGLGARSSDVSSTEYDEEDDTTDDESFFLRPVTALDFTMAIKKLKASVDDNGKEIMKVQDWNEKYGEVKKSKRGKKGAGSHLSLYI